MHKRLGIVISAGGGAFEAMARIIGNRHCSFTVITDRECGSEIAASRVAADHIKVSGASRRDISKKIADNFADRNIDATLLYYDRLVSAELFEAIPTYNIHPAALPAFPGLTGVEDAYAHRAFILGCSLHKVDISVDGGPLVAQIACGVDPNWGIDGWHKRAYLMKVYCGLVWVALITGTASDGARPLNASHSIPEDWLRSFRTLQVNEGTLVV